MSTVLATAFIYQPGQSIPAVATAAVSQRHFVKISADRATGSGNVSVAPAGAGDRPLGVAVWDAATGQIVRVARGGVLKVVAGGVITAGDPIAVGANGTAVTATGTAVVVGQAIASALNGATAQVAFYA